MLFRFLLATSLSLGFVAPGLAETFSVKQLLQKSSTAISQGHYDEAMELLNQALDIDPAYPEIYFRRGVIAFLRRQIPQAELDLNRAIELRPQAYEPRLLRVQVYYYRQDYAKAAAEARWLSEQFPQQWRPFYEWADALQADQKYAEALAVVNKAPAAPADEYDLRLLKAELLSQTNRPEEATQALEALIQSEPKLIEARELQADIYLRQKAYAQAKAVYETLLAQTGNRLFELEISRMLWLMGKSTEARQQFAKAVAGFEQPEADWLIKAGYVQLDMGDFAEAAGFFAQAYALTPSAGLLSVQAYALHKANNNGAARDLLHEKLRVNLATAEDYTLLSWVNLLLKDANAAENAARQGLSLQADEGHLQLNLAHALWLQGKKEEALTLYKSLLQRSPQADGKSWQVLIETDWTDLGAIGFNMPDKKDLR